MTEWGEPIEVNGVRPDWLKDNDQVRILWAGSTGQWHHGVPAECVVGWNRGSIASFQLPADHPHYRTSARPSDELVERMASLIEILADSGPGLMKWHSDTPERIEARSILAELNPVAPVILRAREICAEVNHPNYANEYKLGKFDDLNDMVAVIRALREGM